MAKDKKKTNTHTHDYTLTEKYLAVRVSYNGCCCALSVSLYTSLCFLFWNNYLDYFLEGIGE